MQKTILLLGGFFCGHIAFSQNPTFTQFYANPFYTNPAYTGTANFAGKSAGRLATSFLSAGKGKFRTTAVSWDQPFELLRGGLGVQIIDDNYRNNLQTFRSLSASYAAGYNWNSNLQLRIGGIGGVNRESIDLEKTGALDTANPSSINWQSPIYYPNFGTGVCLLGKKFYIGIAIHNLFTPNNSFVRNENGQLRRMFSLQAGYSIRLNKDFQFTPLIQFWQKSRANQLQSGVMLKHEYFFLGLWLQQYFGPFTSVENAVLNCGVQWHGIKVNYSNSQNLSEGRSALGTAHEISIQYCFPIKHNTGFFSKALY